MLLWSAVLLQLFSAALGVVPDDFMPLLPAPNGQLSNGSVSLRVSSALTFTVNTSSDIVSDASKRYSRIMFAWGENDCATDAVGCVRHVSIDVGNTSTELQLGVDESYLLTVSSDGVVRIEAPEVWGAMYALETLSQLVVWSGDVKVGYEIASAPWHIEDKPRFPHRAVMLDSARHFIPVEAIKRQIDAAAYCKLNTIHWHVTDAESMPIQSSSFPSLASKGAFAPTAVYSTEDVQSIIAYGKARGVRIMPEFVRPTILLNQLFSMLRPIQIHVKHFYSMESPYGTNLARFGPCRTCPGTTSRTSSTNQSSCATAQRRSHPSTRNFGEPRLTRPTPLCTTSSRRL